MVSDSNISDGDRSWSGRKIFRSRGALIGCAGEVEQGNWFVDWWKDGADTPPTFDFSGSSALVLDDSGLYLYDSSTIGLTLVTTRHESIGTGAIGAICAYEAMGWKDPRRAVAIACKHDAKSRAPVRVYHL